MRRRSAVVMGGCWCVVLMVSVAWAGLATGEDAPRYERIVSLSPALTRIVEDLGLGDRLVGVAEHDNVRPELPVAGSFLEADVERILTLRPDAILVTGAGGRAKASVERAAELTGAALHGWAQPGSFEEVLAAVYAGDGSSVSAALGVAERGEALRDEVAAAMSGQVERMRAWRGEASPRRVLVLLDTEPASALGPGSPFVELVERLGAVSASPLTAGWGVLDRERLVMARPEVVLLIRPGDVELEGADDPRLGGLAGLPTGGRGLRVALINDPLGLLPTTTLPRVAEAMADAITGQTGVWLVEPGADGGAER